MRLSADFVRKTIGGAVMLVVTACLIAVGFGIAKAVPVSAEEKPVYRGNSDTAVSLMVNVYWGTEYLDEMLDIFAKNGVKTTFFVGGTWVRDNETMLKKMIDNGHEIGNHGFFHKDHAKLSDQRNREEIQSTHNLVMNVTGVEMKLFAPPSGSFSDITLEIAKELGYTTIMWSKDTIDWRDKDPALIRSRAVKNVKGGDLVLMHPTAHTVDALNDIICDIKKQGLTVAPVSEVIG